MLLAQCSFHLLLVLLQVFSCMLKQSLGTRSTFGAVYLNTSPFLFPLWKLSSTAQLCDIKDRIWLSCIPVTLMPESPKILTKHSNTLVLDDTPPSPHFFQDLLACLQKPLQLWILNRRLRFCLVASLIYFWALCLSLSVLSLSLYKFTILMMNA